MTLTFLEIGQRWPDAVVLWDRNVAPTLDWEPRFVERDGVLWAACDADASPYPPDNVQCYADCRCRVWDPTLKQWWTHEKWDRLLRFIRRHELFIQPLPIEMPSPESDHFEWRMRAWLHPITHRPVGDPID